MRLLDQTKLPLEEVLVEVANWQAAAAAIRDMQVRGAPAIGVTAGYAVAMAALEDSSSDGEGLMSNTYYGNKLEGIPKVINAIFRDQFGLPNGLEPVEGILCP